MDSDFEVFRAFADDQPVLTDRPAAFRKAVSVASMEGDKGVVTNAGDVWWFENAEGTVVLDVTGADEDTKSEASGVVEKMPHQKDACRAADLVGRGLTCKEAKRV